MKVKLDFITNSSSASFILYVTSTENTIDSFTSKWNEYIDIEELMKIFKWAEEKEFEPINIKKLLFALEEYKKEKKNDNQ